MELQDLMADYVSGLLDRGQFAFAKQLAEQQLEQTQRQLDRFQGSRMLSTIPRRVGPGLVGSGR